MSLDPGVAGRFVRSTLQRDIGADRVQRNGVERRENADVPDIDRAAAVIFRREGRHRAEERPAAWAGGKRPLHGVRNGFRGGLRIRLLPRERAPGAMNIAAADKGRERDREVFKRPSELREVVKLIADDRDYGVVILKVRPETSPSLLSQPGR